MYWLKEVVGEDVVNRALRQLLRAVRLQGRAVPQHPRLPALLRAEAGPEHDSADHRPVREDHAARPEGQATPSTAQAARRQVRGHASTSRRASSTPTARARRPRRRWTSRSRSACSRPSRASKGFNASNVLQLTDRCRSSTALRRPSPTRRLAGQAGWAGGAARRSISAHRALPGTTPITVEVDKMPTWVGIDPYNKRIDRNSDDNLTPWTCPGKDKDALPSGTRVAMRTGVPMWDDWHPAPRVLSRD